MTMKASQQDFNRFPFLDFLRSMAIVLMIFFHFHYDLNYFGFLEIDFHQDPFWWFLPRFIVGLFLLCAGMGLRITHKKKLKWSKAWKRFWQIGGCALLISLGTLWLFPESWIFFGTLHCLTLSGILGLLFVPFPLLSLSIGLLIVGSFFLFPILQIPLPSPPSFSSFYWPTHKSLDYIPLYPWIGVFLIGIFMENLPFLQWDWPQGKLKKLTTNIGQHSLLIYLLHQPLLFTLCFVLAKLTSQRP